MGLPDDEIGQLTIAQYDSLAARRRVADNKARLNAGIVAAACMNPWRAEGAPPISPLDFVPDWKQEKKEIDLRTMTPEEQKNYLMNMFMGGGKRSMR